MLLGLAEQGNAPKLFSKINDRGIPVNAVMASAFFTLLCVLIHAWIGLWQVLTDYIKPVGLRGALQFALVVVLFVYVMTGFVVLWGV